MSEGKKLLTRLDLENIAGDHSDLVTQIVDVPEWHGSVMIRVLTGTQRSDYEASLIVERGKQRTMNMRNAQAKLAALSMIDPETGKQLYNNDEVHILAMRNSRAIQRVVDAAMVLNGFGEDEVKKMANGLEENPNEDTGLSSL